MTSTRMDLLEKASLGHCKTNEIRSEQGIYFVDDNILIESGIYIKLIRLIKICLHET
jgi:hypothetical protein